MATRRLAVVGSRRYPLLGVVSSFVSQRMKDTCIVSGGAPGVDRTAVQAAKATGLEVEEFLAQWNTEGRSAGFKRNVQMIDTVDGLVAFWDGSSNGTRHAIDYATQRGIPVYVFDASGTRVQ